ncbi:MAG TPA: 16S rRNA (uracil(1498)-N(3))-methyltransferase [Clostridia bacterium]|nr:16S rRNA (uracil(1498)-N(3))-methyltransferase [Clostridia bacterium]
MHRIFFRNPIIGGRVIVEDTAEIKHLEKVLRAEPGHLFEACDSDGKVFVVEILSIKDNAICGKVISSREESVSEKVIVDLFQALPKKNNMDLIVQKSTELGINSIKPYVSSRTIVKIDEKNSVKKTERWRRIAKEAAKQSKRLDIPQITDTFLFDEMLFKLKEYDKSVLLYENEKVNGFESLASKKEDFQKIALLVGPEGGFSPDEVNKIKECGSISISLGPRILRTETAGFAALSIIQFLFGDMRGLKTSDEKNIFY